MPVCSVLIRGAPSTAWRLQRSQAGLRWSVHLYPSRRIWLVMFMKAVSVLWFVCKQVGTDQRSEGADEQLDLKQWDVRRVDSTQKDSGCLKVSWNERDWFLIERSQGEMAAGRSLNSNNRTGWETWGGWRATDLNSDLILLMLPVKKSKNVHSH